MFGWNLMRLPHISTLLMDRVSIHLPTQIISPSVRKRNPANTPTSLLSVTEKYTRELLLREQAAFSLSDILRLSPGPPTQVNVHKRETVKSNMYECQNILNNKIYIICTLYQKNNNNTKVVREL